jgi:hypothetical protein
MEFYGVSRTRSKRTEQVRNTECRRRDDEIRSVDDEIRSVDDEIEKNRTSKKKSGAQNDQILTDVR